MSTVGSVFVYYLYQYTNDNECNYFNNAIISWMEACIDEVLPPASELDESLRTGVILCKLGHWAEPEVLPLRKIYDLDGSRFEA